MPCFHPLECWRLDDGSITFNCAKRYIGSRLQVPCGQCIGCRLERSRQWAVRCMHESSLHKRNCFVTLTYDKEHMPPDQGLCYRDFQLFMKRLRKKFGDGIRFYMCGEYGDARGRPHFHVLLFNFDFADKYYWAKRNSNPSYRSPTLDGLPQGSIDRAKVDRSALWPYGNAEIGEVTFKSAAYVARYIMKKQTGRNATSIYEIMDPTTGEIFDRRPEFNSMSRRPGIAAGWIEKFHTDVYPNDFVVVNGRETRPPRFYDRFLEKLDFSEYEDLKFNREEKALLYVDNNTPERLAVREKCTEANVSRLKRSLK